MLPGNVLHGYVFGSWGRAGRTAFDGENNLADFDFLTLLDADFSHNSCQR